MNTYVEEMWGSVGLDFDPWQHSRAEKQGILLAIFKNLHVLTVLELSPSDMLDFCLDIEMLYNDVPYHSFNHAVDVVVKLYYVLHNLQASSYLASYDIAVLLISGLCHDAGHPGLNNLFQKNANTEFARKYPNAILERYSIDLAIEHIGKHRLFRNVEGIRDPLYNDSTTTEPDIASRMIHSVKAAILCTDMSHHFDVVEECKTLVGLLSKKARRISDDMPSSEYHSDICTHTEAYESSQARCAQQRHSKSMSPPSPGQRPPKPKPQRSYRQPPRIRSPSEPPTPGLPFISVLQTESISATGSLSAHTEEPLPVTSPQHDNSSNNSSSGRGGSKRLHARRSISMCDALLDSAQRQSLIGILLHAVDVFNPVLPWPMCKKWSDLMNVESFNQGDLEKKLALPVSPNMDRDTTDQRQVSLDFGNIIIRPFFTELVSLFPVDDILLPSLNANLVKWSNLSLDATQEVSVPVGANSRLYSWPTEPRRTPVSQASSRAMSEGRRLSVAAGTVDIPQSRLETIRRHSHEGFEALHRRMVGRIFSKHLEKIQERRKKSYTPSQLSPLCTRHQQHTLSRRNGQPGSGLANFNASAAASAAGGGAGSSRISDLFDSDLLSPVTETSGPEDTSAPISANDSGPENFGKFDEFQLPTPQQLHHPTTVPLGNSVSVFEDKVTSDGLSAAGDASLSIRNYDGMPTCLSSYRIDSINSNARVHRSSSLDPSLLSNLPSTYPSLHQARPGQMSPSLAEEH
ncbi:hypothetical protein GGI12_000341 [Dipsacomyces acuminosporus]|nr:hypothetical protein GGI12_000341 [Dipsacomyces acuminosporus]